MSVSNPTPHAVSTHETTNTTVAGLSRTNLMLLLILLVQLAVSAYLFWPDQGVVVSGEPLLANVTTANVTALTITDNDGRSVSFVKEGELWTLADSDGYPARADKITESLDKLTAIATDRLVTQTAGSHDRLQVADNNYLRKIDLTTANGVQTLYLGSSTGSSATHVRTAASDATYLTSEVATWELDTLPTTWIEVAYFRVPKAQIQAVTLENANGTFAFVRAEGAEGDTVTEDDTATAGDAWTLADATPEEPISSANINTLIDRVATLNLHSVTGKSEQPEFGLDAPLATLTIVATAATTDTTSAPTTTTLMLGAKDEETTTYYLKSSDSEFYVRLAAFTGDEFVNKQRGDFMTQATDATVPSVGTPQIGTTEVATGTSEVDSQPIATDTQEAANVATDVATDTTELEDEAAPAATVEASEIVTDTDDADSDAQVEPEATGTPTN